jgi:hypothetical protein
LFVGKSAASQLQADIAFAVGFLARAMSNPTELHYEYALQVLDYFYTTKNLVVKFAADSSLNFNITALLDQSHRCIRSTCG